MVSSFSDSFYNLFSGDKKKLYSVPSSTIRIINTSLLLYISGQREVSNLGFFTIPQELWNNKLQFDRTYLQFAMLFTRFFLGL